MTFALESINNDNSIYGDMKPSNILSNVLPNTDLCDLDVDIDTIYYKLCDMSSVREISWIKTNPHRPVGTINYVCLIILLSLSN